MSKRSAAKHIKKNSRNKLGISGKQHSNPFLIAGIGASAGGLEAFTQLLQHLPVDTGIGFVLIQHLDPSHESSLTQLLARATLMPVQEITNDMPVEPNHVYVISPKNHLTIAQGVLKLQRRKNVVGATRSIDLFFESLAQDQRERSIGIILSGTATDGTQGLEAIKAEGGIAFAQDESAKYDSMPRSAVAAGCVDFVLSPKSIAKELAQIAKHPCIANHASPAKPIGDQIGEAALKPRNPRGGPGTFSSRPEAKAMRNIPEDTGFKKILSLLLNHCGADFSLYKSTTIERRITRRMVLNKQNTLGDYAAFLQGNDKELDALYSDVLINVTSFFRNPDAFEALKRKIFPKLIQQRRNEPIRIWVPGCSTGQEAYSIAMAFMEFADRATLPVPNLQIFATDLNDALLEKARQGVYAKSLIQDISPERLRRFFTREESGYRISKSLREICIFARQNLIGDPPFSRMNLISCRNLMIYLDSDLQILQFRGPTDAYLAPPTGKASFNVLKMAREGLMLPLQAAIAKAKKENQRARRDNIHVNQNDHSRTISIEVIPLKNLKERCYLILFNERQAHGGAPDHPPFRDKSERRVNKKSPKDESRRIAELERELIETRDYLQAIQEQHETATEELQASNEEVQSANEELQSINEELETSKEELESTNEELTTVNEEMSNRNLELSRLNSDLFNLQNSLHTAIVLLGRDLIVRRFTPLAEKTFNLRATDIGHSIGHIKVNFDFPDLGPWIAETIDTMSIREREVQNKEGHWYSLRARPYLTPDNKIDGAVLMLVDIDLLKRTEQQAREALHFAQAIVDDAPPLLILDKDLRVVSSNRSFYEHFKVSPAKSENVLVYELGNGQWNIPDLRRFLENILPQNSFFKDFEVTHEFETIGRRTMLLNGHRLDNLHRILLFINDITERKKTEELLQESSEKNRQYAEKLERDVAERTANLTETISELEAFSYSISHDMRAPLRAMQSFAGILLEEHSAKLDPVAVGYLEKIRAAADRQDALIQDTLNYTRILRSEISLEPIDLQKLVLQIIETYPQLNAADATIDIEDPLPFVMGNDAGLTQCISNLLSNAVKFILPGVRPQIKIWAETADENVRLWIEDNGIGIDPKDQKRIFKMFERVSSNRAFGGTGIGLAIVRKAMERMGGSVGVESKLGKGSKFWIHLPKASKPDLKKTKSQKKRGRGSE